MFAAQQSLAPKQAQAAEGASQGVTSLSAPQGGPKAPMTEPIKTTIESYDRVPVSETVLERHTFTSNGEYRREQIASLGINYSSKLRKREFITNQTIDSSAGDLAQGIPVTARTAKRGFAVAQITPHMISKDRGLDGSDTTKNRKEFSIPGSLKAALQTQLSEKNSINNGSNQARSQLLDGGIFQGLKQEAVLAAFSMPSILVTSNSRGLSNSILSGAIKIASEIFQETPREREDRLRNELEKSRKEETQRRTLSATKQEASSEKDQVTTKLAEKPSSQGRTEQLRGELAGVAPLIASEDAQTVSTGLAISRSLEAKIEALAPVNTAPISAETTRQQNGISLEKDSPFNAITAAAIEKLKESYSERGAEGRFLTTILEAFTENEKAGQSEATIAMVRTSTPALIETVVDDLLSEIASTPANDSLAAETSIFQNLPDQENSPASSDTYERLPSFAESTFEELSLRQDTKTSEQELDEPFYNLSHFDFSPLMRDSQIADQRPMERHAEALAA